jgi:hypothetical protein
MKDMEMEMEMEMEMSGEMGGELNSQDWDDFNAGLPTQVSAP